MKFIIKTEVSLFKEAFKNLFLVLLLMIPGSFFITMGFIEGESVGIILSTLWCVFTFVAVALNIIKAVLINMEIEKTLDKSEEEKLLKAILEELKASNKVDEVKITYTGDDVKSNFEDERKEKL